MMGMEKKGGQDEKEERRKEKADLRVANQWPRWGQIMYHMYLTTK
jgi:hypothetical protein